MTEMFNEPIDIIENKIYTFSPSLMKILIKDNTTKGNLHWATSTYEKFGEWFRPEREMQIEQLVNANILTPRVSKSSEEQQARTKDKGEVFTPAWMCNMQVNYLDEDWFERKNVFNKEIDNDWKTNKNKIIFSKNLKKTWQEYVSDIRLEITCGEAPYLVSRYDVVKGEIIPVENRIGVLDRKLRIINENIDDEDEWLEQTEIAFKSTYGYDYQGDNVVIARENLLYTLIDNMVFKFGHQPSAEVLKKFAAIVSWNIWQMDGLDYTVPYSEIDIQKEQVQLNLFGEESEPVKIEKQLAKIKNWETNKTINFKELLGGKKMKFNYIIGNPPYQEEVANNSGTVSQANPVYHKFIEQSIKISDKVCLITPSLWMTGGTGLDKFREMMLTENHIKVLHDFEINSHIFNNANIAGGVSYFLWDKNYNGLTKNYFYRADGTCDVNNVNMAENGTSIFIRDPLAKGILNKVDVFNDKFKSFMDIVSTYSPFANGVVGNYKNLFLDKPGQDTIKIYRFSRTDSNKYAYIKRSEIIANQNWIDMHKVFVSKAGEISAKFNGLPFYGEKGSACNETYLVVGPFKTKEECDNCIKYMNTSLYKFLISQIKKTQNAARGVYKYVPIQDFTNKSKINWNKSVEDIEKQLYKIYKISNDEIEYIEKKTKGDK